MQRKRKHLKICFGKTEQNAVVVANNMETNVGNSLSISNMREETEYSTSNFDSKSHATEVTTASGEAEEVSVLKIFNQYNSNTFKFNNRDCIRNMPMKSLKNKWKSYALDFILSYCQRLEDTYFN